MDFGILILIIGNQSFMIRFQDFGNFFFCIKLILELGIQFSQFHVIGRQTFDLLNQSEVLLRNFAYFRFKLPLEPIQLTLIYFAHIFPLFH